MIDRLLNTIRSDPKTPNRQRVIDEIVRENPGMEIHGVDLPGVDVSGLNLQGLIFKKCDLSGVRAVDAGLPACVNCRLDGIDARDAMCSLMHFCRLRGGDLRMAKMGRSVWSNDFYGANLQDVIMDASPFGTNVGNTFDECDMTRFDGAGALLAESSFRRSMLCDARLARSDLRGAVFDGAHLIRCNLVASETSEADWRGAVVTGCTLLPSQLGTPSLLNDARTYTRIAGNATVDWINLAWNVAPTSIVWECISSDGRRDQLVAGRHEGIDNMFMYASGVNTDKINRLYRSTRTSETSALIKIGQDCANWVVPVTSIGAQLRYDGARSPEDAAIEAKMRTVAEGMIREVFEVVDGNEPHSGKPRARS